MFQYTHELVINSLQMEDGSSRLGVLDFSTIPGKKQEGKALLIKRGGEYQVKNMSSVYKTAGNRGTFAGVQFKASDIVPTDEESGEKMEGTYNLQIFVKLLDPHALFEYGYPNYQMFGKPVMVGFDVKKDDSDADIAKKIYDALMLAVPVSDKWLKIGASLPEDAAAPGVLPFEEGSTTIALRATHFGMDFAKLMVQYYDKTMCDSCIGEYLEAEAIDPEKKIERVEPFATGQWLIENLRFPSYPNIRYNAVGKDAYPVAGDLYTMYSFEYIVGRPGLGGLSGVGQVMAAATRHIYYVASACVEAFEQALADAGVELVDTLAEASNVGGNEVTPNPDEPTTNPDEPQNP